MRFACGPSGTFRPRVGDVRSTVRTGGMRRRRKTERAADPSWDPPLVRPLTQ
ncbi:hypothetical protein YT1_5005 [Rhodococcus ruber]|nr:hypothetical protein YT1_5005 [Rhodococcus ruber]